MKQNNSRYKKLIENMPAGYAYHKVILDKNNNPIDYIILEVNKKFENITGLKRENIVGKKISNIINNIGKGPFTWAKLYGKIALSKKEEKVEKYFEKLDEWYEIKIYSEKKGYFTTMFYDITERKKKEEKLKLSKFSLDEAPMEIFWINSKGEIKYVNNTATEKLNYKNSELVEAKVSDIDPNFSNENRKDVWKNLKRNEFQKFETQHVTKNGSKYPVEITSRYIKYNGREFEIAFAQDISARKRSENTLKYSRERYETIFDTAPIGIIIEDKKGNIVEVNEVVCEMTGYTKNELEGSNVLDKLVLPENRDKAKENIRKIIEGKNLELDVKTPSKKGKINNSHLKETNIKLPDGSKGIISMYLDITERVKKRKELEMLNFSINKADLLIFRVTPEGIIDYVNETAIDKLGYKKEKLIGCESKKIIKNEDYIDRNSYWQDIKNSGSIKYEIRLQPKDNKAFPVEVNSQYFKYDNEEYEFAFAQDITSRKEKEKEIRYLLYRDTLTGLYNRRFFNEQINRLDTERQLPISIIMADVNGLKIINDSYGHKKGDELLVKTAKILKNSLRNEDILARHGGDEFAILLPETSSEKAQKIINRIRDKTEITKDNPIPISIGLGIATKSNEKENIEDTLKRADNVMYKNKLSKSKSAKNKIIQNLLNTLAAKSSETKQHAVRIDNLAHELGKKINLSNSELNRLSLLATLHDIGKTTISKNILNKAGDLTESEWKKIKEHPEIGYKIASASDEFALVAEEILCHHEHWDGSGYPRGFKEENIPYLARIISIIDAYDVMTHDRPYNKAMSKKEALAEIDNCAGSQFDPESAKYFIEMIKNE